MEFYVVHKDPRKNAEILPDFVINHANLSNGYQILSDISHYFGVYWKTQNKLYNYNHPECMRWRKDAESFDRFIDYYEACLDEYEKRYNKKSPFHTMFKHFLTGTLHAHSPYKAILLLMEPKRTWEQLTIDCLLEKKRHQLTLGEKRRLTETYYQIEKRR